MKFLFKFKRWFSASNDGSATSRVNSVHQASRWFNYGGTPGGYPLHNLEGLKNGC